MIIVNAKFSVKPEYADRWLDITAPLTEGSRAEDGCLWYEWSRSADDDTTFVLIEGWRDQASYEAHSSLPHHVDTRPAMREALAATPRLIAVNGEVPGGDWAQVAALSVR